MQAGPSLFRYRQIAIKLCSLFQLTEDTDSSIVGLNHFASDRETKSCPLALVSRTPIKLIENPGLVPFAQAWARVDHAEANEVRAMCSGHQNNLATTVTILERVREEI